MRRRPTKAQQQALLALWKRTSGTTLYPSFIRFRRNAYWSFGVLLVPWCGMYVGIEPDGYTHT